MSSPPLGVIQAVPFEEKSGGDVLGCAEVWAARPAATITASGPLAFSQFRLTRIGASLNIAVSSAARSQLIAQMARLRCADWGAASASWCYGFRAKDHCPHVECRTIAALPSMREEERSPCPNLGRRTSRASRSQRSASWLCCSAPPRFGHSSRQGRLLLDPTPRLAQRPRETGEVMAMIPAGGAFPR